MNGDIMDKLNKVRKFITEVKKMAQKENLDIFIVSEGASGYSYSGKDKCVKAHRDFQIKWEKENGFDPDEDWSNENPRVVSISLENISF
jgi:hypothetical protein